MIDLKLFGGFGDGQTNERTFAVVESLSRLKKVSLLVFAVSITLTDAVLGKY